MSAAKLRTKTNLEQNHEQQSANSAASKCKTNTATTAAAGTTTNISSTGSNAQYASGAGGTTATLHSKVTSTSLATTTKTAVTNKSGITTNAVVPTVSATANNAPTTHQLQQQQQQQPQTLNLPQTSLLKIEPFVPSFNSRTRRPIHRSHSTLSSTYLRRTLSHLSAHTPPIVDQQQQQHKHHFVVGAAIDGILPTAKATRSVGRLRRQVVRYPLTRQRSKSNSSMITHLPTAARSSNQLNAEASATSGISSSVIVTQQPNGICRIARTPQEQDKLPDRINYDRRGLTAIPIFEHEPHLRLLSLQHNLINVFHIPKEGEDEEENKEAEAAATANVSEKQSAGKDIDGGLLNGRVKLQTNGKLPVAGHALNTPPQPLTMQSLGQISSLGNHLPVSKSAAQRGSSLQRSALYSAQQQQLLQQQQPQYRFAMKKSKSFITNYSRHINQHHLRRNLQKPSLPERVEAAKMLATLGGNNLLSFDSGAGASISTTTTDSNSTLLEEQTALQELAVKNKQLVATYGLIFQNLVFLDLYDNQIERVANLDGLPMLSVLLLGKNRITDISGLSSLKSTLRVLDLHGNKITSLSNKINCLQELKSLNLAGNQIRQINQNDFNGLLNLKELNLKRNRIKRINGFQHLTALERLWLCHNDLHKVDDMSTIAKALNLLEVTIENNPVSLAGDCVSFIVSYLPRLQSLSQMPITDQVRRAAMAWRKNKEHSDANYSHLSSDVFNSIRREEVISNARTNWELLRSQQTLQQGAQRQRTSPKQRELARINESSETNGIVEYEKLQEFIKLPPIQLQQDQAQQQEAAATCDADCQLERQIGSANSSLGPNVDSSSSCYSSGDNEPDADKPPKRCKRPACTQTASSTTATTTIASKQPEDIIINQCNMQRDHKNQCQAKITTMPPVESQQNKHQTETTTLTSCHTTSACHSGSASNKIQKEGIVVASPHGISNSCTSDKQASSKQRALQSTAAPRSATTTTPITASSSTLSLGFQNNGNNNNGMSQIIPTPRTHVAPNTNPKRYMQGSLMRSHTMVGSGAGKPNATSKANGNQSQQNQQQNLSTYNSADQNRSTQHTLSCIVAPATATTTTTTTTIMSQTTTTTTSKTSAINQASNSGNSTNTTKQVTEREREQGGDYLIEICGRYLNVYGQGALRYIDKQWNPLKANDVHTLNFSYINFNNIATILGRIKVRFPHAEHFVFRETNISCLGQLNALAELQGIASLCIDPEGNAITTKDLWRLYAVYRLSHWGLKLLNGSEVSEAECETANSMYAGLSDLVLWSMPEAMLQPLLARLRLDETCTASKLTPKEWLMKADKSLRIVVGKEALQWKKSSATSGAAGQQQHNNIVEGGGGSSSLAPSACTTRERAKLHFATMMENTCNAVEKLHKLETLWPSLLQDIVRNTLLDYSQMDVYLRNLMTEIMK